MNLPGIALCFAAHLALAYGAEANASSRVVGGQEAVPHSYPSLTFCVDPDHTYAGQAALLHPEWILTSAAIAVHIRGMQVYAGRHNIMNDTEASVSQHSQIDKKEVHPGYTGYFTDNIAVVKLKPSFQFNEKVQPVPIATDEFSVPEKASIVGWGVYNLTGDVGSNKLLEAEVPVVPNPRCDELWNASGRPDIVYNNSICAGEPDGSNACFGDLGAPLYAKVDENGNKTQVLLGVMIRPGCFPKDDNDTWASIVTIYTRVSKYVDWIQSVTGLKFEPEGSTGYGYFTAGGSNSSNNTNSTNSTGNDGASQSRAEISGGAVLKLASGLADNICAQVEFYSTSKTLSPPVKKRPAASSLAKCNVYEMQKCESDSCQPFHLFKVC